MDNAINSQQPPAALAQNIAPQPGLLPNQEQVQVQPQSVQNIAEQPATEISTDIAPTAPMVESTIPAQQAETLVLSEGSPTTQLPATASPQQVWSTEVHTDSKTARDNTQTTNKPTALEADDVELIEKPWVDSVEKIIDTSKDDPFTEDTEHHKLSREYKKTRFNIDVM